MGPGWWRVGRLWALLGRQAASPLAGPLGAPGPRLPWLAEGLRPAGSVACLSPGLARGLHSGPQREELAPGAAGPLPGAADHTGAKFDIDLLVSLLRQENARDICVIKVPPEMRYTDYFVIGSGTSTRHLHAMAYYIVKMYKYLKCKSEPHVKIEGKDTDDWLCVDFDLIGS